VVICLELGADLHIAQLMPMPLTVSCFSKIEIGFTFLVPAHLGSPGKRAVKWVCVWGTGPNLTLPMFLAYTPLPVPRVRISVTLCVSVSRPMSCELAQTGSHPITFLWLWPATDHEPHCRHMPLTEFEGGLNLLHEAHDDAVIWLESTETASHSTQNRPCRRRFPRPISWLGMEKN